MPTLDRPTRRRFLAGLGGAPPLLAAAVATPAQARPVPRDPRSSPAGYDPASPHVKAYYRTSGYEPSRT